MISVAVRMISSPSQSGPFTIPVAQLTARTLVAVAELPKVASSPLLVCLQLVRPTGEHFPVHELLLEATSSPISTTRWTI